MRKVLIIIAIFSAFSVSAKDNIQDSNKNSQNKRINTKVCIDSTIIKRTSTNLNHSGEINIKSDKNSIIELILPSFIALLVGLMAYLATIRASKQQSNIVKKQMENNKLAITDQIESSIKIADLDFRKTVLSANRQAWINDLRIVISELISLVNMCSLSSENIKDEDYRKITFLTIKAEFMLNPTKDKDYINSIVKLQDSIYQLSIRKKEYSDVMKDIELVKENTKLTLKNEWEKVKRGE